MAGEIQLAHDATAETLYAIVRNSVGQAWDTGASAFEAYATASLGDYDIALVEQGTASRYYVGTFPSAIAAGVYSVTVYVRAGGSPAEGDDIAGAGSIEWSGTAVIPLTNLPVNVMQINSLTGAAQKQAAAANSMVSVTVTTGSSTTVIETSSLSPAAADTDQFAGRALVFLSTTTTTTLRGTAARIASMTAGGQITLQDALGDTPVSGDLAIIV
jgi:hypothetical protein